MINECRFLKVGIFTCLLTILLVFSIAFIWVYPKNNFWLCLDGDWTKVGRPLNNEPEVKCEKEVTVSQNQVEIKKDLSNLIKITSVKAGDTVSSPLEITGEARGNWFFEAEFPIVLLDENGKQIAWQSARAQGDWMTEDFVPFKAILTFEKSSGSGTIVVRNSNPSGLPENELSIKIPVNFKESNTQVVKVYFGNKIFDPEVIDCRLNFPVERIIPKTTAVARAAINELLSGTTQSEAKAGYFTNINSGVVLQKLTIDKGIAIIDFNSTLEKEVGGSCRTSAIISQIQNTLLQFDTIKEVIISINGRTEDILQP